MMNRTPCSFILRTEGKAYKETLLYIMRGNWISTTSAGWTVRSNRFQSACLLLCILYFVENWTDHARYELFTANQQGRAVDD